METLLMRLQSKIVDMHRELSARFMQHVQLDEQFKDNEVHLHFQRGYIQALCEMEKMISEGMGTDIRTADRPDSSPGLRADVEFEGQAMDKPDLPPDEVQS